MKFEFTEDTAIRLSAISHAVSGVQALVTPNEFQDTFLCKGMLIWNTYLFHQWVNCIAKLLETCHVLLTVC